MRKIENPVRLHMWRVEEGKNGDEVRNIYIVAQTAPEALERAITIWGAIERNDETHFTVAYDREARV